MGNWEEPWNATGAILAGKGVRGSFSLCTGHTPDTVAGEGLERSCGRGCGQRKEARLALTRVCNLLPYQPQPTAHQDSQKQAAWSVDVFYRCVHVELVRMYVQGGG